MVCCTFLKENLAAIPRTECKETSQLAVTGDQQDVEVKGQILGRRCRENCEELGREVRESEELRMTPRFLLGN